MPRPAVVVLTAFDYPQYAEAALRLGASAFVLKSAPIGELLGAIRRAAAGGLSFSKRPGSGVSLTRRELEVIRLVSEGRSNDEIASALGMGPKTVETHLRKIFERHSIASRTELAARAIREGWLELPLPPASRPPEQADTKARSGNLKVSVLAALGRLPRRLDAQVRPQRRQHRRSAIVERGDGLGI